MEGAFLEEDGQQRALFPRGRLTESAFRTKQATEGAFSGAGGQTLHYTTDIYDRTVKQRALLERAVKIIDYEILTEILLVEQAVKTRLFSLR